MGSSDGAEISELVGLLMLNKLVHLFQDDSVGLYRDDGLGVLRDYSGPETERLRKNVVNLNVIFHLQKTIVISLIENQIIYQYSYTNTRTIHQQF